ncbi:UDP-N-acetylmuramoyl-tripeptide--D-alanyl-D-alanine ligase [Aliikangiella sp. IMCC44653]
MIDAYISQIAKAVNGRFIGEDVKVNNVYTDSRKQAEDALFIALKGPHFDAHNFLTNVVEQGAKAILVECESHLDIPQIIVKNTHVALAELAKFNRQQANVKCVAITGSSGKTTVKEMLASIFKEQGETLATLGNLNNEIGAPLTVLRLNESHEFAVIELGANHAGEIAYTAAIAKPDIALINNVAAAHLEGFGDLQGVARAKGEIYSELTESGIAVINNDDDFASYWKKHIKSQVLTFAVEADADVTVANIKLDENQCATYELLYKGQKQSIALTLAGRHNVYNSLAAATCAIAAGIPLQTIAKGLTQVALVQGRLNLHKLANGCQLIDDTYNANLASMQAAIQLLAGYANEKVLVIGDMAELGEAGRNCHQQIGQFASEAKIDKLYSCGLLSKFAHGSFNGFGKHFSSQQELIQQLKQEANADSTILVKGSRSAHMDRVVKALMENTLEQNSNVASSRGEK